MEGLDPQELYAQNHVLSENSMNDGMIHKQWNWGNVVTIYDTRPWKVFGEEPAQQGAPALTAQGFNEGKGKPFTDKDVLFVIKGNDLYATVMGWPESGHVL